MSYLRFPTQPLPPWARFGRYGPDGTYGYQVDARGLDNQSLMLHEELVPLASDLALFVRLHLSSSVIIGNPAFEGLAPRHRGYVLEGTYPDHSKRKVWDSNPSARGVKAWFTEKPNPQTGTTGFVTWSPPPVDVPKELGIDYVSYELIFRGISGQWTIGSMEFRHAYAKNYEVLVTGPKAYLDDGLTEDAQTVYLPDPSTYYFYVRYVHTVTVDIRQDQIMNISAKSRATGGVRDPVGGFGIASVYGIMVKMRIRGSTLEDSYIVASDGVTFGGLVARVEDTISPKALNNYDRMQTMVFVRAQESIQTPYRFINFESVELTLHVDDPV